MIKKEKLFKIITSKKNYLARKETFILGNAT